MGGAGWVGVQLQLSQIVLSELRPSALAKCTGLGYSAMVLTTLEPRGCSRLGHLLNWQPGRAGMVDRDHFVIPFGVKTRELVKLWLRGRLGFGGPPKAMAEACTGRPVNLNAEHGDDSGAPPQATARRGPGEPAAVLRKHVRTPLLPTKRLGPLELAARESFNSHESRRDCGALFSSNGESLPSFLDAPLRATRTRHHLGPQHAGG